MQTSYRSGQRRLRLTAYGGAAVHLTLSGTRPSPLRSKKCGRGIPLDRRGTPPKAAPGFLSYISPSKPSKTRTRTSPRSVALWSRARSVSNRATDSHGDARLGRWHLSILHRSEPPREGKCGHPFADGRGRIEGCLGVLPESVCDWIHWSKSAQDEIGPTGGADERRLSGQPQPLGATQD